jgi:cytoskeletal protein CcmA (bactofilin family)
MLFSRKSETPRKAPERATQQPVPDRVPDGVRHRLPDRSPAVERLPTADSRTLGGPTQPTQSFIDGSLTIVGDLLSEGDVRIDGRICGNVRCAQLILGQDAAITGSVVAEQAIVRGRIIGTIRAPVVVIQDSAHVESEITYSSLTVDDGAYFEGTARRRDNPLAEQEPRLAASSADPAAAAEGAAEADASSEAAQDIATDAPAQPPPSPKSKAAHKGSCHLGNGHSPAS